MSISIDDDKCLKLQYNVTLKVHDNNIIKIDFKSIESDECNGKVVIRMENNADFRTSTDVDLLLCLSVVQSRLNHLSLGDIVDVETRDKGSETVHMDRTDVLITCVGEDIIWQERKMTKKDIVFILSADQKYYDYIEALRWESGGWTEGEGEEMMDESLNDNPFDDHDHDWEA